MFKYFAVLSGGAIGALLRFVVATAVVRFYTGLFPLGTFLINVTGSFVIGLLMTFYISRPSINLNWRLFAVVGILGGYTTFSSFEWETLVAAKTGAPVTAVLNVSLSVFCGFLGVWLGEYLAKRIWHIT